GGGGGAGAGAGGRRAGPPRRGGVLVAPPLRQGAGSADPHRVIEGADDGSVPRSGLTRLDDAGRVVELSRMLAGLEDSEFGRAHAGELLAAAAAERAASERAGA